MPLKIPKGALDVLRQARDYTEELFSNGELSAVKRKELLAYLKDADPALKPMYPGVQELNPRAVVPLPGDKTLYRGGPSHLTLQEPIFMTYDPQGAAFYAIDRSKHGVGAVGEYKAQVDSPAYFRDILQADMENPGLVKPFEYMGENILDWAYNPKFKNMLKDKGYDALVAADTFMGGEIPTIVGLDKNKITPQARTFVTHEAKL